LILVLASASPRRRDLLEWAGLAPIVRPTYVDESIPDATSPEAHALRLAEQKATAARLGPTEVILGADTVVHLDGAILDKPVSRTQALQHLERLSGREHLVTTGVHVATVDDASTFSVTTRVRFRPLTPAEIVRYVDTGEADDKAGAYGIQGLAGGFVAELHGSWTNVMGLPLESCLTVLDRLGVPR
jgi:septum formation protein